MTSPSRHDEGGAVLIAVLVFMLVWGVVIIALTEFAETGFNVAAASGERTSGIYALEGATEAAIAYLADDPDADCPEGDPLLTLELNGVIASVECTVYPLASQTRMVDLRASGVRADPGPGDPWRSPVLQARVMLDDDPEPGDPVVELANWTVIR